MNFRDTLLKAKAGDGQAISALLEMYKPLLMKHAIINGNLDEDLLQEQYIVLLRCIEQFQLLE